MGIRVHKALGYGLNDLKHDANGVINDDRINLRSPFWRWEDLDLESFIAFLEVKKNLDDFQEWERKLLIQSLRNDDPDPRDCFSYDSESEMPSVLIVTPPSDVKEWKRYDDMMDYLEEPRDGRVTIIDRTLYPYDSYMHAETGNRVPDGNSLIRAVRHFEESGDTAQMEKFAVAQGYKDAAELRRLVVPVVPIDVQWLCEWAQIFKDPKTVLSLRPMIHVYWG